MKTKSLYIASKGYMQNATCKDFASLLKDKVQKVALFRPIGTSEDGVTVGFSIKDAKGMIGRGEKTKLFKELIDSFKKLQQDNDFVLCEGVDSTLFGINFDFDINLEIAKNLGIVYANVLKDNEDILDDICVESASIASSGCTHFATFVPDCDTNKLSSLQNQAPILNNFKDSLSLLDKDYPTPTTPSMFEFELFARAKEDIKTIVLPESDDDRILKASSALLEQKVVNLVLLGDEGKVKKRASQLGLNLDSANIIDPETSTLCDKFAKTFYELRKSKGISEEDALKTIKNPTYFATMMVYEGDAHGMVSGAVNTTADTIRPALQIIKTKPGISIVSSVFFMCLDTKVYAFGDCAVNPDPNSEHLAQIALTSAQTASLFGVDPKVAMLSYSTGSSGQGESVDKVIEALKIAKEANQDIKIDGPIQFDAAVDKTVASKKMPGSLVAGDANTFIFPDLNAGNITYKAVQRTANAIAIGPVLQGLKKPINDLSRGCLVEDIINTIAITAIQAQGE